MEKYKTHKLTTITLAALLLAPLFAHGAETAVDPCGPITYPGMTVNAGKEGVQAPGYTFVNHCKKPTPWQAQWIWLPAEAKVDAVACFRKEVTLSAVPDQVMAWISADMKYRLWINGRLVSRGPVDIGRDVVFDISTGKWFYDTRDLTPYFRKGVNVIAAEVFREWPINETVTSGHPGLIFEAELTLPGAAKLTLKSDATWRGTSALHYLKPAAYDADKEPVGWRLPGFNDAQWLSCIPAGDYWSELIASEMPPLMEVQYPVTRVEGLPENRVFTKDGSFRVVFDRVLSAYPFVKVKGGKDATLTIHAHRQASFQLGGGEQTLEFPFMSEVVSGFTVEIKNVTEPVEILDSGAVFTSQPVEYRGTFACSDETLNRIWKTSRWPVQLCMQTYHLDSPNHQEPLGDFGDYAVEAMVAHDAFHQPWLARQDVRKFAWILKNEKYLNFHTSYSICWLQMLMDYFDYTGDKTLVEEMAPYVHGLMDTYASWRGKNGILSEAQSYMFMDWVKIEGFDGHHPPAVIGQGYLTAFYYHGMEMASRVAALTGDKERVAKYAQLRSEIAEAFNRELWNDAKGLYRDGKPFQSSVKQREPWLPADIQDPILRAKTSTQKRHDWVPEDKDIETFSPHVNMLAVLYDLAPKERQAAIVKKALSEKSINPSPYFIHWVFQAIDHAGLFDKYGTEQMRRWRPNPETQSFPESWAGGDMSHGWCSTPLVQMSARVLGVTPTSPGFTTLAIRPSICDLTWARGVVPTPHGDVHVSWTWTNDTIQLDVIIPDGISADVILPDATKHVNSGKHSFQSSYKRKA